MKMSFILYPILYNKKSKYSEILMMWSLYVRFLKNSQEYM